MDRGQARLEWLEYLGKAAEAFVRDIKGVVPGETCEHLRTSQREFLLAIRSLLDRQIEKLGPEKQAAQKVEVQ